MPGAPRKQACEAKKKRPMSNDLKIAMGLIESLYPGFRLRNWKAIAEEDRNSLATVKQRFPKTIAKYKAVRGDGLGASNSPIVLAPAAPLPPSHDSMKGTQSGSKRYSREEENDGVNGDDSMPPPPPPKRARRAPRVISPHYNEAEHDDGRNYMPPQSTRRVTRSITKAAAVSDAEEDALEEALARLRRKRIKRKSTKRDDELYEAARLRYDTPRGWPVPRDNSYQEWFFPGDSWGPAEEEAPKEDERQEHDENQ